ncbi:hypothetical protein BH11ARM2_BH11ARM2_15080 [soil metagenome]
MLAAVLLSLRPPVIPPVIRHWRKKTAATFRVRESIGDDETRIEMTYTARVVIVEPGKAKADLTGRKLTLSGKRQGGYASRLSFPFSYDSVGPVAGNFDSGLGTGSSVVWALSSPGWGGTGFTGKMEKDGWHGDALFGASSGNSTIRLHTYLGKDGWPRKVELQMRTPAGGYDTEIVRI